MPSAGQLLQSERLKRNKSLAEVAAATRISARYLEAIESDDVRQLPGEFFYKAFLRQYAHSLDLDSDTSRRILASAVPVEERDPLPVLNDIYVNSRRGRSTRWAPPTGVAVGLLVIVLAGGSGLYALWQKAQARKENAAEAPPTAESKKPAAEATHVPVTPRPAAEAPVTATPAPAPTAVPAADPSPQSAAQPAPSAPPGEGTVSLEVSATEPAWVTVSSAGKTLYIGTLQPSDPRKFALGENAKLFTGNAGSLEVRMNGKPLGAIGSRGQVRTVLFTNNDFQILPPKPKPLAEKGISRSGVSVKPASVDR